MDNNSVFPSSLMEMANSDFFNAYNKSYNNTSLKCGFITRKYGTEDDNNLNKRIPEYDVLVVEQDEDKATTPVTYKNCISLDSFGAIADFFDFTRLKPFDENLDDPTQNDGSVVLLMSINGSAESGVIIGAIPHFRRKNLLKDERHLEGEFNGLRVKVNKDGELSITFRGATDNKGKPKETNGGTSINFEKDGSLELNDAYLEEDLLSDNLREDSQNISQEKTSSDVPFEKIRIDRKSQKLILESRKGIDIKTEGQFNLDAKEDASIKTKANLNLNADGDILAASGGMFSLQVKSSLSAKAASWKITSEDSIVAQATLVFVTADRIILGKGASPSLMYNTQMIGTGNLGGPVVSTPIGPFSSTVFIGP